MFLGLSPNITVITNVEHDHPDCFPTPESYVDGFQQFINRLQYNGVLLVCADDFGAVKLANSPQRKDIRVMTFGKHPQAVYSANHIEKNQRGGLDFNVHLHQKESNTKLCSVSLQVPGEHNMLNALAAIAVAHQLKLDLKRSAAALGEFSGTGRRFDLVGESGGIIVIDDYAHHPTEVRATLAAARSRYPQARIWAVWQPHTYSRTLALLDDFIDAFQLANEVIVTDVYAAREKPQQFSVNRMVEQMQHPAARFIPTLPAVTEYLLQYLRSGDVLLVLSAGDADQISNDVMKALRSRENNNG